MSFKEVESSYAQLMLQYANERLLFHIKTWDTWNAVLYILINNKSL